MRTPTLLFTAIVTALPGCVSPPQAPPITADSWVDDQIAQSATAISLTQQRLHTTSAVTQKSNLTGVDSSPPLPRTAPLKSMSTGGTSVASSVAAPAKTFPVAPSPAPTIVNVIAAPAVPPPPVAVAKASSSVAGQPGAGVNATRHATPGAPAVPIAPLPKPEEEWVVSPTDVTLRRVLAKWADRAGWQLVWDAPVDVPVDVKATLKGDFRSVVKKLFLSLSAADVNLTGYLYAGNRVLRVAESGRRAE